MKKIFQLIFITLILQDLIAVNIPIFTYEDEFIMALALIYCLILITCKRKVYKLSKYDIIAFITLIFYIFIGIASNLRSNIIDLKFAILSLLITIKGYLLYFEFRILFQSINLNIEFIKNISKILKIILVSLVLILIINFRFQFLETRGIRFGVQTYAIGFSHPTELAFFSIIAMCIILFYNNTINKKRGQFSTIVSTSLLVFFSGRSKAIAFMVVFIVLFYFIKIMKKFKIIYFVPTIPIMFYIGLPRMTSELGEGARGHLYRTSFKIAKDFFPFGSGFGTFGSYISRLKYSLIYFQYWISDIWGLSPQMPLFIADTYWAMILGETGFIGMTFIFIILICIYIQFFKFNMDYMNKIIIFGLMIYTLISSIAEPIYSSNKSAALFIVLAFFVTVLRKNNYSLKNNRNL